MGPADYYYRKNIYIWGGAGGLGLELACALAENGAHIAVLDRCADSLSEAEALIARFRQDDTQTIASFHVDQHVDSEDLRAMTEMVVARFGPADMIVVTHKLYPVVEFLDSDVVQLAETFRRELIDGVLFLQTVLVQNPSVCHVVLQGALDALTPYGGSGARTVAQATLKGLAAVLKKELALRGGRVSLLCPARSGRRMDADTTVVGGKDLQWPPRTIAVMLAKVAAGQHIVIPGLITRCCYRLYRFFPCLVGRYIERLNA